MDKKVDDTVDGASEHDVAARHQDADDDEEQPRQEDMKAAAEYVIRLDKEGDEFIEPMGSASRDVHHSSSDDAVNHQQDDLAATIEDQHGAAPSIRPRSPIREVLPGAYRVPGPGVDADQLDVNDDFSASPPFVADSPTVATNATVEISTAELFDADAENRDIDQLVQQRLQEIREGEAVAEVVPDDAPVVVPAVDQPPSNGPNKGWAFVSSFNRRELILAVNTTVLTVAAIILWIVFATIKEDPIVSAFPTPSPTQVRKLQQLSPEASTRPTTSPTGTPQPTEKPTIRPTITPRPTGNPSTSPTDYPSAQPSFSPTAEPTFSREISATVVFNQRFEVGNQLEFNETERSWFCQNMEGYTDDFGGRDDERVNTTCRIISQRLQIIGGRRRALRESFNYDNNSTRRRLQGVILNQVEYGMTYRSKHTNVTWYPTFFQNYVNEDLDRLTTDLQLAGLKVTNSFLAFNNIATLAPTVLPTITPRPMMTPSPPAPDPTIMPSPSFTRPPLSDVETAVPSLPLVSTASPTVQSTNKKTSIKIAAIVVTVLAGISAAALVLMIYFRRKRE